MFSVQLLCINALTDVLLNLCFELWIIHKLADNLFHRCINFILTPLLAIGALMTIYKGKGICGGVAVGQVMVFQRGNPKVKRVRVKNPEAEITRFEEAKAKALAQLEEIYQKALVEVGETNAQIFESHSMMLEDED